MAVDQGPLHQAWLASGGDNGPISASRHARGEQGVWQRRFFEHTCRDEEDLKRCVDYTHVNPLKHGLVTRVRDWPWNSFHWGNADVWFGDEFEDYE